MSLFKQLAQRWLPAALMPKAWSFVYEGANASPRRSPVPGASPRDAKLDLSFAVRRELVRRSRYLHKNSGFVRELVGNMAIYSTGDGIRPQAQSPDPAWNRMAEDYFKQWSSRCEITGRFSFEECQAVICRGVDVDGEYFVLKTRDRLGYPAIQLIEAHRIGDTVFSSTTTDGLLLDEYGAPYAYRVIEDLETRDVAASQMLHVFEPEYASAVRNAPTIQHSINHVIDVNPLFRFVLEPLILCRLVQACWFPFSMVMHRSETFCQVFVMQKCGIKAFMLLRWLQAWKGLYSGIILSVIL